MSLSIILLLFVLCSVSSINLNGTMKIFGNDYITSILVNHTEEYANFNRYINYTTVQFRIESDQLIEIVLNKHSSETKEDLGFIASIEVENSHKFIDRWFFILSMLKIPVNLFYY